MSHGCRSFPTRLKQSRSHFPSKESRFETAGGSRQHSDWTRRQFFLRFGGEKWRNTADSPPRPAAGRMTSETNASGHLFSTFNPLYNSNLRSSDCRPVDRWHHCSLSGSTKRTFGVRTTSQSSSYGSKVTG